MKILNRFVNTLFAVSIGFSLMGFPTASAHAQTQSDLSADLVSPKELLAENGTLKLDGNFNGSLDLSGWDVTMDPSRGPVFSPLASDGDWANVGDGGGAINGRVFAVAVDGSDVYLGGEFRNVNNIPEADYVVRWDGSAWHALGNDGAGEGSIQGVVNTILVYAPGVVFIGGYFYNLNNYGTPIAEADNIVRWDGTDWSAVGSNGAGDGALNNAVHVIARDDVYLYVGGDFTNAAGLPAADFVARFDVDADGWAALGNNGSGNGSLNASVYAIAINDTGVYIGGTFANVVNVNTTVLTAADYIAKWNYTNWSALGDNGSGDGSLTNVVYAIAIRGSGVLTQVYVGGGFFNIYSGTNVALPGVHYLTFFDGSDWGAISGSPSPNSTVWSILFVGAEMYVGGFFTDSAGLAAADYLVKYNFNTFTWSALGNNGILGNGSLNGYVFALATDGTRFYVGGSFNNVNDNGTALPAATNFATWSLVENWNAVGSVNGALQTAVTSIAVNGTDVYIGGHFVDVNNHGVLIPAADYIAKWDGSNWASLGSTNLGAGSLNGEVNKITVHGSDIYVGGWFTNVQNGATTLNNADYIAKWDGSNWSAIGASAALTNTVWDIEIASNGDLYVGGYFNDANGIPEADKIARFDGVNWSALGGNLGNGSLNGTVYSIALQGTNVYAGGGFTNVQDGEGDYIAKWDGSNWSTLGNNGAGNGALNSSVLALAVEGNNVYAGGNFTNAANIPEADHIALWNGSNWSALGANNAINDQVTGIVVLGQQVFIGGVFNNAGSDPAADYVARWDGATWSSLGSNGAGNGSIPSSANTLILGGTDLYVGGNFVNVNNNGTVLEKADYLTVYGLDSIAPTVFSVARTSTSPTKASSVDFNVTFSEPVTGVDPADFTLTTGGVSGATVSGVSGSGSSYTVSVNTGTGSGTIRLDIVNNGTILDAILNPMASGFTSGETYKVRMATFADVPIDYWAWQYIERLYNAGVTGGCSASPLNYCPDSTVTRAQMAIFLLKGMHGSSFTPPAVGGNTGFADVSVDYWAAAWIKQLAAEGITGGCGNGIYCLDATVTRAQMAVFLLKAKHGSSYTPPSATGVFSDVPVGYWADRWIEQLSVEGVTSGCGTGIYCPDSDVTRAQMAVFLVKTFNLP